MSEQNGALFVKSSQELGVGQIGHERRVRVKPQCEEGVDEFGFPCFCSSLDFKAGA